MTTKTLRQIAEQDQAELAERHNGTARREYQTDWVIYRMRKYLPPEHIALANRLAGIAAQAEGLAPQDYERVDGAGNGAETGMLSRLDAGRALTGFKGAVHARLGQGGAICVQAIYEERTLAQTIRLCGYAAGSDRSVRQLVQLTMMAAQDYDDECRRQREAWRTL